MVRCEDAPCCGCCPSSQEAYYDSREDIDLDPWADAMDGWGDDGEEEPWDGFRDDVEADADTLASAGYGTDEDYGYYGDDF